MSRWRRLLRSPLRRPGQAAVAALAAAVLACAAYAGLVAYRLDRDRAAAREAVGRHDFPEAGRLSASCLAYKPRDAELLLLAAQAARRDGHLDEAQALLDRHWKAVGDATADGALQQVLVQVQRGQVEAHVKTLLEQIEVRHPDSEQIIEALAVGCVHAYQLRQANFWTKQLLERYPDNATGRLLDAEADESLGRRQAAVEKLAELVEDRPHFDRARTALAELLVKRHQYLEAAAHYRELRRRRPGRVADLLGLVRALSPLDRPQETAPLLDELRERHGDDSEALLECARHALRDDRPREAEGLLRRAERLAPFDPHVHSELAVCLKRLDRPEESDRHRRKVEEIETDLRLLEKAFAATVKDPRDVRPRREAGRLCLKNGQTAEGLRWLYGVLDQAPSDRPTHALLAEHYAAQGEERLARTHREKAK